MLVRLAGFERRKDGVVVYVIQVERVSGGLCEMWEVRRRFSEFRKLHLDLGDKRPFPSRFVLCRSFGWLDTRQRQLEDWLRSTVAIILGWGPLNEFLRVPFNNSPKKGRLHQLLARFRTPRGQGKGKPLFDLSPLARALAASRVEEDPGPLTSPEPLQYTTW